MHCIAVIITKIDIQNLYILKIILLMSGPTFEINRIKIITTHSYNLDKNQDCTICRQHLNSSSIYALEKGIKSQVQQGTCGHMFHNECIDPWLDRKSVV